MRCSRTILVSLPLMMSFAANAAPGTPLVIEAFSVPTADSGINLYVHHKHPRGTNAFPAEQIRFYEKWFN